MAQPLVGTLSDIREKITTLSQRQDSLLEKIRILEEENINLKAQLKEERANLDKAKKDIEFLTVSHRLADSPDALISTRRHIARLIRTIDNCIAMINEA